MTFRAVDQIEAEQADFVVCMRVADLAPISSLPPAVQPLAREVQGRSERLPCQGCGATVLRDTVSPKRPPPICTHCAKDVAALANRAAAGVKPS